MPLMTLTSGVFAAKTLAVAVELDIFTLLSDDGEVDVEQLAKLCGIEERPADMLLTACASLGLLNRHAGRYGNSALSEEYLVRGKPYYFGDWVRMLDQRVYPAWLRLQEAVRNNRPVGWDPEVGRPTVLGAADKAAWRTFWEGMNTLSRLTARVVADRVDLSGTRRLLDVGGGGGAYDIEFCRRYPQLKATVFDLPFVCELTAEKVERAGLGDRIALVAGDFFTDSLPGGHDTVLLSNVLHDWTEDDARRILRRSYESLPPGGTLMVVELMVDDGKAGPPLAALMSLTMLVQAVGRNYPVGEYRAQLTEAGFEPVDTIRFAAPGANGLILARKP
jgi:3-hydroxy-5-methyl-1-naphthoate 3-O-methyltransferase